MSSEGQPRSLLDELHNTLEELSKAAENIVYMQQTLGSLRSINLRRSYTKMTKLLSSASVLNQFKNINLDEISTILQSPLIREILTDPDFYQLFAPDTGSPPEASVENLDDNKNRD